MDNWDEEKAFDEKIAPLIAKLGDACYDAKIPFLLSFVFAKTGPFEGVVCLHKDFEGRRVPQYEAFASTVVDADALDGKSGQDHVISPLKPGN